MSEQIAKRAQELKKKSKSDLWTIVERHSNVMCREANYLKSWLIDDVLVCEFGTRAVNKHYEG